MSDTPDPPAPVPEAPSRRALLVAASLAALAGARPVRAQSSADSERKAGPLPAVGTRLVLPDLPLLDGTLLRPADLAGQVAVLYWWASWCPFCAVQSPVIDRLDRAHRSRGLRVVGLSIDRKAEYASAHLAKKGYAFSSAWLSPTLQKALPRPKGLPVTVVLGRDGRVVLSEAGQMFPEDVEGIAGFL